MSDGLGKIPQIDALEHMVNLVLEQIGRLFADAAKGDGDRALGHGSRLKQILPKATQGYHDALDQLEQELDTARAVLRRDYAVYISSKAQVSSQEANGMPETITQEEVSAPAANGQDGDISMNDALDSSATQAGTTLPPPDDTKDPVSSFDPVEISKEPPPEKTSPGLQVDTSAPLADTTQPAESGATTGGYSAMDFDSLLNDPDSAEAEDSPTKDLSGPDQAPATTDSSSNNNIAQDFSFEAFNSQNQDNVDNDSGDISSLLPGLESYANATNDAQDDFQMPDFGLGDNHDGKIDPNAPGRAGGDQQTGGDMQRDTTFDDLLNMDFDMSALDGADGNFEDGGTKFDESFFDLE